MPSSTAARSAMPRSWKAWRKVRSKEKEKSDLEEKMLILMEKLERDEDKITK